MIYALNVYNLVEGKESVYREYAIKGGQILKQLGARVVIAGQKPLRHLAGDKIRNYFLIVEFPGSEAFEEFRRIAGEQDIHRLREEATTDYIWTIFEPWNLKEWVQQAGSSESTDVKN